MVFIRKGLDSAVFLPLRFTDKSEPFTTVKNELLVSAHACPVLCSKGTNDCCASPSLCLTIKMQKMKCVPKSISQKSLAKIDANFQCLSSQPLSPSRASPLLLLLGIPLICQLSPGKRKREREREREACQGQQRALPNQPTGERRSLPCHDQKH